MNENKPFCPLLAISNEIGNPRCVADCCAWWVYGINGGGYCAIQALGAKEALEL